MSNVSIDYGLVHQLASILAGNTGPSIPGNAGASGAIVRQGVVDAVDTDNGVVTVYIGGSTVKVPCVVLNSQYPAPNATVAIAVMGNSFYCLGEYGTPSGPPVFSVLGSGSTNSQSVTAGSTVQATTVLSSTAALNVGGFTWSSGSLTIPIDGWYQVSYYQTWQLSVAGTTDGVLSHMVKKNGTEVVRIANPYIVTLTSGTVVNSGVTKLIDCAADDVLTFFAINNFGDNELIRGDVNMTWIDVERKR